MTKTEELKDLLTTLGVPVPANATIAEMEALVAEAQEAQAATAETTSGTPVASLATLFKTAPVRLTQENFEGVEIGTQAAARLTGARKSRNGEYWLGTFTFAGFGTVSTVMGAADELSIKDAMDLKGFDMTLTYVGQTTLPTRDNGEITLPRFRLEF